MVYLDRLDTKVRVHDAQMARDAEPLDQLEPATGD